MSLQPMQVAQVREGINEPYRDFFEIQTRLFTQKSRHLAVIKPERIDDFLSALVSDHAISAQVRVGLGVILSGGLRVSELLSIRRLDCKVDPVTGDVSIEIKVKKKHAKAVVKREIVVHRAISDLLKELLSRSRGLENIFDMTDSGMLKAVKRHVGKSLDLHALRHSYIALLLFQERRDVTNAGKIMQMSNAALHLYTDRKNPPETASVATESEGNELKAA